MTIEIPAAPEPMPDVRIEATDTRHGCTGCGDQRTEEWRPIPGFDGRYDVSDHGRVRSWVTDKGTRSEPTGVSATQRWRNFLPRGAAVLLVYRTETAKARRVESETHRLLRRVLTPAFTKKRQAVRLLGCSGAGYSECYVDNGTAPVLFFATVASHYGADEIEVAA